MSSSLKISIFILEIPDIFNFSFSVFAFDHFPLEAWCLEPLRLPKVSLSLNEAQTKLTTRSSLSSMVRLFDQLPAAE